MKDYKIKKKKYLVETLNKGLDKILGYRLQNKVELETTNSV